MAGSNTSSSVTLVRVNDGVVTLRCDLTLPTGVIFTTKTIQVGKPLMSGGSFTINGQNNPLAIFNETNTLCQGEQSIVTGAWNSANSVIWTGPGYSHPSVWHDEGFNTQTKVSTMSLHIYQIPGTGYWKTTGTNGCGSTTYNIAFEANTCTNTDPCVYYKVSPNPTKGEDITIIAKPAPLPTLPCNLVIPKIDRINVYDQNGSLIQTQKSNKATNQSLRLSTLRKGFVIVEIISGKHSEKHKIILL